MNPEPPPESPRSTRDRQLLLLALGTSLEERLGAELFRSLPRSPGVYFFRDAAGRLLYIGQSGDLRARVGSYRHVSAGRHARRTLRLVARIARIDWQTCATGPEAVELERVLLLEHRPPFNRAGVWPGSPWWLSVGLDSCALELRLLSAPPLENPGLMPTEGSDSETVCLGPLPAAFRHAHASLLRCLMRLLHPTRSLGNYPLGMLNRTAPLAQRLWAESDEAPPLAGEIARELRAFIKAMSGGASSAPEGDGGAFLARLETMTLGSTPLEQEYWRAERDAVLKYAAKRRPVMVTEALLRKSVALPLFPDL